MLKQEPSEWIFEESFVEEMGIGISRVNDMCSISPFSFEHIGERFDCYFYLSQQQLLFYGQPFLWV